MCWPRLLSPSDSLPPFSVGISTGRYRAAKPPYCSQPSVPGPRHTPTSAPSPPKEISPLWLSLSLTFCEVVKTESPSPLRLWTWGEGSECYWISAIRLPSLPSRHQPSLQLPPLAHLAVSELFLLATAVQLQKLTVLRPAPLLRLQRKPCAHDETTASRGPGTPSPWQLPPP